MKKAILFKIHGDNSWIGGVYYINNIIFSIVQNKKIMQKYKVIIECDKDNLLINNLIINYDINVVFTNSSDRILNTIKRAIEILKNRVKFVYNIREKSIRVCYIMGIVPISWVPDFQDKHYPDFFAEEEIRLRDTRYRTIAKENNPLVLSSNAAKLDFEKYVSKERDNVYVIPFVSYIENFINDMTEQKEKDVLNKYGLDNEKYVFIANQFWKHKNHIIVLKAIAELKRRNKLDGYKFIFTGKIFEGEQRRRYGEEYYESLEKIISENELDEHIAILGFIDRMDQLILMKNAHFLIQPSLFEGWGTVLEDAKVLDKTVLLSDISVHREQMNKRCILFDPLNENELADKIIEIRDNITPSDIKAGIADMYKRAADYSKEFEKILL